MVLYNVVFGFSSPWIFHSGKWNYFPIGLSSLTECNTLDSHFISNKTTLMTFFQYSRSFLIIPIPVSFHPHATLSEFTPFSLSCTAHPSLPFISPLYHFYPRPSFAGLQSPYRSQSLTKSKFNLIFFCGKLHI